MIMFFYGDEIKFERIMAFKLSLFGKFFFKFKVYEVRVYNSFKDFSLLFKAFAYAKKIQ